VLNPRSRPFSTMTMLIAPSFLGFRLNFIYERKRGHFVRHCEVEHRSSSFARMPFNAAGKSASVTWNGRYTQFIFNEANAALCMAGEAVCVTGAPNIPTILVGRRFSFDDRYYNPAASV